MDQQTKPAKEIERKARIFISYSRKDMAFADRIDLALKTRRFEPLIDRSDIYAFEEWWKRIESLIARADAVVFLLSPDSVSSDVALKEVSFAASLNKRLAPIVCRYVESQAVPEALAKLNFVFFVDEGRFEHSADELAQALNTDVSWVRQHTEFGEQARQWALAKAPNGLLLRSPVLEQAERWISSRPRGAPSPTEETQSFIRESRKAAMRRRNVLVGSLAVGLILSLGLAGLAYWQRGIAVEQRNIADEQRDKALTTQSWFLSDLADQKKKQGFTGEAMQLALEALPDRLEGRIRPFVKEAYRSLLDAFYQHRAELIVPIETPELPPRSASGLEEVVFTADGNRVLVTSIYGRATLLTLRNGSQDQVWQGDSLSYGSGGFAVLADNGNLLFTSTTEDNVVQAWDVLAVRKLARIRLPGNTFSTAFALLKALGKVPGIDAKVRSEQWDLTRDGLLRGLVDPDIASNAISGVTVSPDGTLSATSSYSGFVQIRAIREGNVVRSFRAHGEANKQETANSVAFNPTGRRLATTSSDSSIRVWDLEKGRLLYELKGHESATSMAVFSPDGQYLLSRSDDSARLWNADSGELITTMTTTGQVTIALFSPDGTNVVVGSSIGNLAIWSISKESVEQIMRLAGHSGSINAAAFSPDNGRLVTESDDKTIRVWDLSNPNRLKLMESFETGYAWADWSTPLNRLVAAGDRNRLIHVWDMQRKRKIADLAGHTGTVSTLALSRNGSLLVSASYEDGTTIGWDIASLRKLWTHKGAPAGALSGLSFSADGKRVLIPDKKSVVALDAETGAPVQTYVGAADDVRSAYFSENGTRVIASAGYAPIQIWDTESGQSLKTIAVGDNEVEFASLSADGRTVLIHHQKAVKLLDADTANITRTFTGHEDPVNTAVLSPDRQVLLTASGYAGRRRPRGGTDNTVRLWDANDGALLVTIRDFNGKVMRADFDSASGFFLAFSLDGYARFYPYPATQEALIALAKAAQRRCLSIEQRRHAYLDRGPPHWCITGPRNEHEPDPAKWDGLWPYNTSVYKDWLVRANKARILHERLPEIPPAEPKQ